MYEGILGIKKPIFGLDIGYNSLKVVQVKGEGRGASLVGAAEVAIGENSLTKDGVKDKQKVAQFIRQAVSAAKPRAISARIVASALPESLVFTKTLDLPAMSPQEIGKNIPYQATEFFPIPAEETYMDWQIVGQKENALEVLVVAAPKILVDALYETVKLAGFDLLGLETKPVAVVRALLPKEEMRPHLIVDIGAENSNLTCFDEGTLKMTSTAACGGNDLQKDPQNAIKALSSEIIHLMKYYQNRVGQAEVFSKILLAGGGANAATVGPTIENLVKIKTEVGLPQIKLQNYNPKFAAAIGLAMKKI